MTCFTRPPTSNHQAVSADRQAVWIEPLSETDLDAVIALQQHGGLTPWPRAGFERELSNAVNMLLVAAEAGAQGRRVIGFLAGRVAADEFEIHDVVVAMAARRRKVGTLLINVALAEARARGATRALLEVRASNEAAIALYQRLGFRPSGIRKAYYQSPVEDAWLMAREGLEDDDAPP